MRAFGLHVTIQEKEKTKESNIRSAFLKGNTKEHLLLFYADEDLAGSVARSELIKIKFEVDINPPEYAGFYAVVVCRKDPCSALQSVEKQDKRTGSV